MEKNIELEYRASVPASSVPKLKKALGKMAVKQDRTKRISMMAFGKSDKHQFDIRVRITNGEAEAVIKRGDLHSHDRIEISQPIASSQFLGFVKLFATFGFDSEIAERDTTNYYLPKGVVASLVQAGDIYYLEIEKVSTKRDVDKNSLHLMGILDALGMKKHLLKDKNDFDKLCSLLSKKTDWRFHGTAKDYTRLESILRRYV